MAKTKAEKITGIEEEIRQLENGRRQLVQEQKDRTKRLCRRMGLLESLVSDTIPLTEEQFKTFLEKTVATGYARRILDGMTAQNAPHSPRTGSRNGGTGITTPPTAQTAHTAREGGADGGAAWAQICNQALEQNGHGPRVGHRSYERQRESGSLAADQIPTVHLGVAASDMEKRSIRTGRGGLNREIEVTNQRLRQLKGRISKLQNWLKEESGNTKPPTLAGYIQGILSRMAQTGKPGYSQSLYNLEDAANMLKFLQANNNMDMTGLDEKFKSMIGEQLDIQGKLKPVERRLGTLKKHLEQAGIYFKYKGKKPLAEAEQILLTAAKDSLKGVMNGKTAIPAKAWKEEYTKLTAERKTPNQRYLALKEEVKEAGKIRKSVYGILRQEQREQQLPRTQDTGYGEITHRAAGIVNVYHCHPCFGLLLDR